MSKITLGIDFGCSNVTVVSKEGLLAKQPNIMAIKKSNNENSVLAIGEKAQSILGKTTEGEYVFYLVNSGEITNTEYAKIELSQILKELKIKSGAFSKIKVIAPIPAGINDKEKNKYNELFKSCGISEVICIPKIFVTALGENINIGANSAKLVVDIGGGNIECGVINLNSLVCCSSLGLGGRTVDLTIVDYIKQKYGAIIGENTALMLKEQIFSLYQTDTAKMEVSGVSSLDNNPVQIIVSSQDIYEATHTFFDEIVRLIKTTINSLPPEISGDVVRNGIYVSGGMAKIPGLGKYLKQQLNINVTVPYESENSTIKGLNVLLVHNDILENILENL